MNPPFTITIEKITEATQCHHVVSQLLRIFPSLRLTITENETIPTPAGTPQTCHADDHCLCASCRSLRCSLDAIRYISAAYCAAEIGRMGTDEARQAAERAAKSRAEADAVHSQNIAAAADGWAKFRASEEERIKSHEALAERGHT